MKLNWIYIASQIFVLGNYTFLAVSYFAKDKQQIVRWQTVATASNTFGYGLLGAWAGLAMCCIALVRNAYLTWDAKRHAATNRITRHDVIFLIAVYAAVLVAAILTYNGPLSLLIVAAFALQTFSIWQKRAHLYKFIGIPLALLYMAYNAYVRSLFGTILEAVVLGAATVGYILDRKKSSLSSGAAKP